MYKKLSDVIDKQRTFSMLYSGVEDSNNFHILYDLGIRNFLMSYHYVQSKQLDIDMYQDKGIKFFIDSGAFTYMSNPKYQENTVEQWEGHIERYLEWAKKHKDIIFAIASLDLEYLVGGDKVQEWNEKYFEPFMLETGIPVCFVWHEDGTKLSWEDYCKRYPYVGVSWGTDSFADGTGGLKTGQRMLKVAEKYGAVVHGMAMTRTSLLTKLPFYTVDSTTWLVGLQYGEVNYWRGTRMSRLKKEAWKGEYLPKILNQFEEYNLDRDKLLAEDNAEMIKVNVLAFIKAQEYIVTKLTKRMYWLKPQAVKNDRNDLDVFDKFPQAEWIIEGKSDNWEEYCKNLNIGVEDTNIALLNLVDCTCFCMWDNPELADFIDKTYTDEVIKEVHDNYINTITSGTDEQIADLQNFYWECVEGKNDTLLLAGSSFDRKAKDRDNYIEEETEDIIDVDKESILNEITKSNPNLLADGKNEIDELDDEIFSNVGIQPVRDSKGRFLKGQKKIRKPKNIYSKKYPKLACDTCYAAQSCPEFKSA